VAKSVASKESASVRAGTECCTQAGHLLRFSISHILRKKNAEANALANFAVRDSSSHDVHCSGAADLDVLRLARVPKIIRNLHSKTL